MAQLWQMLCMRCMGLFPLSAGFVEDVAAAEVAAYRDAAERGRMVLAYTRVG